MQLLSVLEARSVWFVDLDELNPTGISIKRVLDKLVGAYGFTIAPSSEDLGHIDSQKGVVFDQGIFKWNDSDIAVKATMFPDGFIVDTSASTKASDAFLTDLLERKFTDVGLCFRPEMITRKAYKSQVLVSTDKKLATLNPNLAALAAKITALVSTDIAPASFEFGGLIINADPAKMPTPSNFTFERRLKAPFRENKYFSVAPLQTHVHLEILNELESLLGE
jgi:hypothetical protein